jgi:hypothetical protein
MEEINGVKSSRREVRTRKSLKGKGKQRKNS